MSDYIPGEIQVEILKLLPVSSLLRFRSVCQWWKQVIDSHSFIQHHLALQKPQFIFDSEDSRFLPSFDNLTWPIDPDPIVYHIIGALHGVVCFYDYGNRILLWNPSIRKLSIVPEPFKDWQKSEYASLAQVFEINYSAFWMDPCTKQYKIIMFKLLYDDEFIEYGEMYSSIGQNWKPCPLSEVRFYEPLIHNPCIVIGAVAYWLSHDFKFREHGVDVILLCFDFEEVFDTIEAPSYNFDDRNYFDPVVCNLKGSLSLVYLNPTHRCEIYSRQQGSWVNLFGFTVPCHITRIRVVVDVEEKQEDCRFIASTDNELVLCDTSADLCTPLKRGMVNPRYIDFACYFVESLLLP